MINKVGLWNQETKLTFFWFNFVSLSLMTAASIAIPIFFIVFYYPRFKMWSVETFSNKWCAIMEGLKLDKIESLIYPVFFVIRRMVFTGAIILLQQHFFIQLLLVLTCIGCQAAYLLIHIPFISALSQRLDVLNEFTNGVLVYHVLVFDMNWVQDGTARDVVGYSFVGILGLSMSIHVFFLLRKIYFDTAKLIKTLVGIIKMNKKKPFCQILKLVYKEFTQDKPIKQEPKKMISESSCSSSNSSSSSYISSSKSSLQEIVEESKESDSSLSAKSQRIIATPESCK